MMIYKDSNILNEAYFGKLKYGKEMENCIHEIRTQFGGNDSLTNIIGGRGVGKVEGSKPWIRLKELIENQFGFYSITFILDRSSLPNAYTIPVTCGFDTAFSAIDNAMATNNGFRYKKDAKYCTLIAITEGLLFNKELTDGEILAVLLHEVGHNFDSPVYRHLPPLIFIDAIFNILSIVLNPSSISPAVLYYMISLTSVTRRPVDSGLSKLTESKIWAMVDTFMWLIKIPQGVLVKLLVPILKLAGGIRGLFGLLNPLMSYVVMVDGYTRENIADKFVAMHGYGPEFASAMAKMENEKIGTENIIDKVPVIAEIYGMYLVGLGILVRFCDPHPQYAARVQSQINAISTDVNNSNLDPKTKKQLKDDIARINKSIEKYLNEENNSRIGTVKRDYQRWLFKTFPGFGDFRYAVTGKQASDYLGGDPNGVDGITSDRVTEYNINLMRKNTLKEHTIFLK